MRIFISSTIHSPLVLLCFSVKGRVVRSVRHLSTVMSSDRACSEVYLFNCEGGCEHYG